MDKPKRFLECLLPTTLCNLEFHYCYVIQENRRKMIKAELKYSPEHIAKALSKERLDGSCWISICGAGETLIQDEVIDILHHRLAAPVDPLQDIQIPEDQVGFGQNGGTAAVPLHDFQRPAGDTQRFLHRGVGIGHGAGGDHAPAALALQRQLQKLQAVFLHGDVLEPVIHAVAAAPGIAVDASVLTAPVQVHAVSG